MVWRVWQCSLHSLTHPSSFLLILHLIRVTSHIGNSLIALGVLPPEPHGSNYCYVMGRGWVSISSVASTDGASTSEVNLTPSVDWCEGLPSLSYTASPSWPDELKNHVQKPSRLPRTRTALLKVLYSSFPLHVFSFAYYQVFGALNLRRHNIAIFPSSLLDFFAFSVHMGHSIRFSLPSLFFSFPVRLSALRNFIFDMSYFTP